MDALYSSCDASVGQLVAIGVPDDREAPVFVTWCTRGFEHVVLDAVDRSSVVPVAIIAVIDASYRGFRKRVARWKGDGLVHRGKWFKGEARGEIEILEQEAIG